MAPGDDFVALTLGAAFGLSLAVPPGQVNAAMALEATRRSWIQGSLVGAGALTTDATYFALTYLLGAFMPMGGPVRPALFTLGASVLLALAWLTWRGFRSPPGTGDSPRRNAYPYLLGLILGFTNPLQMLWWLTVGLGMIVNIGLVFVAGFFTGIAAWVVAFPRLMALAQARYPRLYPAVVVVSVGVMVGFAGWFLYQAVATLA